MKGAEREKNGRIIVRSALDCGLDDRLLVAKK